MSEEPEPAVMKCTVPVKVKMEVTNPECYPEDAFTDMLSGLLNGMHGQMDTSGLEDVYIPEHCTIEPEKVE